MPCFGNGTGREIGHFRGLGGLAIATGDADGRTQAEEGEAGLGATAHNRMLTAAVSWN